MGNSGIYNSRKWFRLSGQTAVGTADTLEPIGVSGENDTIAIHAIPTFSESVTFTLGADEAMTLTCTDISAPLVMTNTMSTAGKTGCRALFKVIASAKLGGWANALKGYLDITTTTGGVTGLGSAICSELRLPGSNMGSSGTYAVHEYELVTQASGVYGLPITMQWFQVSGNSTATTSWENNGYFMVLKGFTAGNDKIFATVGDVAAAGTLRILIGDTPYYLMVATGTS